MTHRKDNNNTRAPQIKDQLNIFQEELSRQLHGIKSQSSRKQNRMIGHVILEEDCFEVGSIDEKTMQQNPMLHNHAHEAMQQNQNPKAEGISQLSQINPQSKQFQWIQNQPLRKVITKYFQGQDEIELKTFIEVALFEFLPNEPVSDSELKMLQKTAKEDLTTTSQSILSLNALEILVKKQSLREYFIEKILRNRHRKMKSNLEEKYSQIHEALSSEQKVLAQEETRLKAMLETIQRKEKELTIREKEVVRKEKELKEKESKLLKTIEDKGQKLMMHFLTQVDKAGKLIEKKINTFERSVKYKIDILDRRATEIRSLQGATKVIKKGNQSETESVNQKLLLKKYEKQIEKMRKTYEEQIDTYEKESNDLIKAQSFLEKRLDKVSKKNKGLEEMVVESEKHNIELIRQMQQKDQSIEQLKEQIANTKAKEIPRLEESSQKVKKMDTSRHKKDVYKQKKQMSTIELLHFYEEIVGIVLNSENKGSTKNPQIYQALFSNRNNLLLKSSEFFFIIVQNRSTSLQKLLLKLYLRVIYEQRKQNSSKILEKDDKDLHTFLKQSEVKGIDKKLMTKDTKCCSHFYQCVYIMIHSSLDKLWILEDLNCMLEDINQVQNHEEISQFITSQGFLAFILMKYCLEYKNEEAIDLSLDLLLLAARTGSKFYTNCVKLENYKVIISILLHCTHTEVLEKASIILQRLCYYDHDQIQLSAEERKKLQQLHRKISQHPKSSSLLLANLKSISEAFD